jgi:hypothetical protein
MSQVIDGPLVADLKLITVRSNMRNVQQEYKRHGDMLHLEPSSGSPVALWEKHEAHPNGEVLVTGNKSVRVARTERVVEKLRAEELIQVSDLTDESTAFC